MTAARDRLISRCGLCGAWTWRGVCHVPHPAEYMWPEQPQEASRG